MGRMGAEEMQPVTGAPFSATETIVNTRKLADGNTITRQFQANIYRDSQGRVRRETTMQPVPGSSDTVSMTRIVILDPVAGVRHVLDTQNKISYDMSIREGSAARAAPEAGTEPSGPNVSRTDLGAKTIDGLTATGTRITRTIPAGAEGNSQPIQIVREVWMSTDLHRPLMVKSTDPRFGTTVSQLSNIKRGEPDPSLFQVPAGYTTKQAPAGPGLRGRGMGHPRE
jgi:hypothetical protein